MNGHGTRRGHQGAWTSSRGTGSVIGTPQPRRATRWTSPAGVVAAIAVIIAACSPVRVSSSATPLVVVATPPASTADASNVAVASMSPSPTLKPPCAATVDHTPSTNPKFSLSGTNFAPNVDILLWIGDSTLGPQNPPFNATDSPIHPPGLHTGADGAFGPYEMHFDSAEPPGPHSLTVSDGTMASRDKHVSGGCQSTVTFTLAHP